MSKFIAALATVGFFNLPFLSTDASAEAAVYYYPVTYYSAIYSYAWSPYLLHAPVVYASPVFYY